MSLKRIRTLLIFIGKPLYWLFIFILISIFIVARKIFRLAAFKKAFALFSFFSMIFLVATALMTRFIFTNLPTVDDLLNRKVDVSTKIYDRNRVLLYKIYKDQNRTLVKLEDVSRYIISATLAAEDADFYKHPGFSLKGIARAFVVNTTEGKLTGGSTITQQLIKNTLLSSEKTLLRKVREVILALEVEKSLTKDQILEMYLNEVSYGGAAYGIQEASRQYFDKDAKELTLTEAALLAGLPKAPTKLSPFGANPELSLNRQKEILGLMFQHGFITKDELEKAQNETITFAPNKIAIKAPHFVMYIRELLVNKYGEDFVERGGLSVVTTIDYDLQKNIEEIVKTEVEKLKDLKVSNGAALVINAKTGEILAMIGSKDYFDILSDGNVNIVTRLRQPGSSIKVINYAYALSNGLTPASLISDTPVTFSLAGHRLYSPKNYDNRFRGNLTLRSVLAESRNIPAVKVLASYGVDKMIELGRKMGITTWLHPESYGLSLTLGGGDIKLIDLTGVYATIANYGLKIPLTSIIEITDNKNKIVYQNDCLSNPSSLQSAETQAAEKTTTCKKEEVLDPRVAFQLIDILADNKARTPAFGANSSLVIKSHPEIAVKTGTSNNLRDNLTLGFNQDYVVSVWVGNNDNSPMSRLASGITGAAPIWNKIMTLITKDSPSKPWSVPEGLSQIAICAFTGSLPCAGCPIRAEWFLEENKPRFHCDPEKLLKPS